MVDGVAEPEPTLVARHASGWPSEDAGQRRTLSAAEVATLLGVSEGLVYKMARSRELPSIRIGGRVLFLRAEIARLVAAAEAGADDEAAPASSDRGDLLPIEALRAEIAALEQAELAGGTAAVDGPDIVEEARAIARAWPAAAACLVR